MVPPVYAASLTAIGVGCLYGYLKHAAFRRFADELTRELKPPSR